jgi:hypothetical protein
MKVEIQGGAGELHAAAIVAALTRLYEEQAAAAAVPVSRPGRGLWVMSGLPRPTPPVHGARPSPASDGWSVGSTADDE